jgi:hypothetical protein
MMRWSSCMAISHRTTLATSRPRRSVQPSRLLGLRRAGTLALRDLRVSELYVPDPDGDLTISGRGFELTLRVPRAAESRPPDWPFTMINEMAKHVNVNSVALEAGHRIDLRQAVTGYPSLPDAPPTGLTVFAVMVDPELQTIATANGRVTFLQLVGVTQTEKDRMVAANTAEVLAELSQVDRLLITDPARA